MGIMPALPSVAQPPRTWKPQCVWISTDDRKQVCVGCVWIQPSGYSARLQTGNGKGAARAGCAVQDKNIGGGRQARRSAWRGLASQAFTLEFMPSLGPCLAAARPPTPVLHLEDLLLVQHLNLGQGGVTEPRLRRQ